MGTSSPELRVPHLLLPQLGPQSKEATIPCRGRWGLPGLTPLTWYEKDMGHMRRVEGPGAHLPTLSRLLRHQDSYLIVLAGVLTFLSVPVTLIVVYGFWKKRHMGSE